jgi:hypothetical protein
VLNSEHNGVHQGGGGHWSAWMNRLTESDGVAVVHAPHQQQRCWRACEAVVGQLRDCCQGALRRRRFVHVLLDAGHQAFGGRVVALQPTSASGMHPR